MFGHKRFFNGIRRKFLKVLTDKLFIYLFHWEAYGYFPNLNDPKTFDEKLQWYKLYYRVPLMTTLADKYEVRLYLEDKGFDGILNELYGVYNGVDEIDFFKLPERFVIKATHGSSMNIICKDKKSLNWENCRHLMNKWLKRNYYHLGREWTYKHIKPRLICEKYLENEECNELIDYKFYCYNNNPEVLFVPADSALTVCSILRTTWIGTGSTHAAKGNQAVILSRRSQTTCKPWSLLPANYAKVFLLSALIYIQQKGKQYLVN